MNIGNQWLILVLSTIFTWGTMLFLRTHLPQPFTITSWLPVAGSVDPIIFELDERSWAFAFALVSILSGMILVDTVHLREQTNIRKWSRIILLFLLGLVGCLINSLLAFILCWTLIDLIGLIVQIAASNQERAARFITVFFLRMVGTLLVLVVMVRNPGSALDSTVFGVDDFTFLIAGASLRMVFFTNNPGRELEDTQSGFFDSTRKVISPMLAIVFLSRLQIGEAPSNLMLWFLVAATLMALTAAIRWFANTHTSSGESNVIFYFCGLALVATIRAQADATALCGFLLPLSIGWPRLYSYRFHKMHSFLILFVIALLGLPYTFSHGVLGSMATGPLQFLNPLLWISLALLVTGFIRAAMKAPYKSSDLENWMKLFYAVGLALVTFSLIIPGLWQLQGENNMQYLAISGSVFIVLILTLAFTFVTKARVWLASVIPAGLKTAAHQGGIAWGKVFGSDWIQRIVDLISRAIRWVISGTNAILEGEGGLLWSFVFLALLLSLLVSGVGG